MLQNILLVGFGGFLGSVARYLMTYLLPLAVKNPERAFPFGTFAVNIIGSFAIGILFALFVKNSLSETWRLFLMAGICGGFTTFSAFSLENMQLLLNGQFFTALIYIVLSLILGLGVVWIGYRVIFCLIS